MKALPSLFTRLHNLFRRPQLEKELDAELSSHLQFHIDDNLHRGLSPDEARRQALLQLGGLEQTKERVRALKGSLLLVAVGIGIGLPLTFITSRLVSSMLFGLKPTDAASLLGALATLVAIAALACYLPARRASRVDPLIALRHE